MKTPPFLMLVALAFWGWQANLLTLGLAMGVALEASRRIPTRWEIRPEDFRRLWNVTVLLALAAALYLFLAQSGRSTVTSLLRDPATGAQPETWRGAARAGLVFILWLPIMFYPFLLAHTYSRADWLPWSTVSPYLHWRQRRVSGDSWVIRRSRGLHPTYPYLALTMFASMASDRHAAVYFPALALIVGWALRGQRSPRFRQATWCGAVAASLVLAFAGVQGLRWAFDRYERWESQWLSRLSGGQFGVQGTLTDIGAVGRRKLSGRILLRVRGNDALPPPLLREAVFNQFRAPYWTATRRDFQPVLPQADMTSWRIAPVSAPRQSVSISRYTRGGETLLALPDATFEVRDLLAAALETNRLTVARVHGAERLATYSAHYGAGPGSDAPPDTADVDLAHLRPADQEAITNEALKLDLARLDPRDALDRVRDFLLEEFQYALPQTRGNSGTDSRASALGRFLSESRRGHCEYFATATALLLRTAGIPTRYVVGYSVQERKGDQFIVRARHAHAWCLVFVDGEWETVDNTPGGWVESESRLARLWEPLYDRISQAWFAFTRWRQRDVRWRFYFFLIGIGILAFMAARELRGSRWRTASRPEVTNRPGPLMPGSDSEFYVLEQLLARRYAPRPAAEPVAAWIARLPLPQRDWTSRLRRVVRLHYQLRFDPAGLTPSERTELRTLAQMLTAAKPRPQTRP